MCVCIYIYIYIYICVYVYGPPPLFNYLLTLYYPGVPARSARDIVKGEL